MLATFRRLFKGKPNKSQCNAKVRWIAEAIYISTSFQDRARSAAIELGPEAIETLAELFSVPVFIEVALIALGVVLLLYYRHAKKWALLAIAAIYAVNVGIWLFSIAKGAPPDFAGFAISSVVPILLLGVGATHWPSFK